jgi:hypothetical protein
VGRGDFDPSTTKILHLINNPERQAWMANDKFVAALKNEIDQLRVKVAAPEDSAAASASTSTSTTSSAAPASSEAVGAGAVSSETALLLKQLQESNGRLVKELQETQVRMEKVKAALKNKIQEFRKVCYDVFGYQIDFLEDRQFRLKWMYAMDSDGFLLKLVKDRSELLETEFSQRFPQEIAEYLTKLRSLPMLMAHVTIKLFQARQAARLGQQQAR